MLVATLIAENEVHTTAKRAKNPIESVLSKTHTASLSFHKEINLPKDSGQLQT